MPLFYPQQQFGRFRLGLGLTSRLLHERFGVDFGERFHRDIMYRIETLQEVDRAAFRELGQIGLGFREPFPRATIEPFGHRFVPVLYGCSCAYAADEEPAAVKRPLDHTELAALPAWTQERLERSEAVRIVVEQFRAVQNRYGDVTAYLARARRHPGEWNPHYQPLSSLQNLGSVINTAVSVFGEEALYLYADDPGLLESFYANVTELMLLCLDYFPRVDSRKLEHVFVGDCTVAMISPRHYREHNFAFDRRLAEYARSIGASFLVHQDSDVTPHLPNYTALGPVQALDVGQDTDFEQALRLFPDAEVSCILFPSWIRSASLEEIRGELDRLMAIGSKFRSFSFSIFEVDPSLAEGRVFELYDVFRRCAEKNR